MSLELANQVCFIAGASRGIGLAIGQALLAQGSCVVLTGRDENCLRAAFKLCEVVAADRVLSVQGDLTDNHVIASALEKTIKEFGHIDHLIANLGSGSGDLGWDQSDAEWMRLFEENFFASTRLARAVLPHLQANESGGSIIFISSIAGLESSMAPLPYSSAKAALISYSKNLARQVASLNVRVNTIAPGNIFFPGGSWDRHLQNRPGEIRAMLDSEVPQRRFGAPEEIASLAAYLCSPGARFATGGCCVMDGGQTRGW